MTLHYTDPLDPTVTWQADRTVQVGFVDESDRKDMSDLLYRRRANIFDLYRAPEKLLPNLFDYSCFLRILDFVTYLRVEDQIKEHLKGIANPLEVVPTIVYGAGRDQVIDHIAIIDGSGTHPRLLSSYYLQTTKDF